MCELYRIAFLGCARSLNKQPHLKICPNVCFALQVAEMTGAKIDELKELINDNL